MKEMGEIHERVPRDPWLLAEPQGFAERAVEHPGGNLAAGCAIVLVELAPEYAPPLPAISTLTTTSWL